MARLLLFSVAPILLTFAFLPASQTLAQGAASGSTAATEEELYPGKLPSERVLPLFEVKRRRLRSVRPVVADKPFQWKPILSYSVEYIGPRWGEPLSRTFDSQLVERQAELNHVFTAGLKFAPDWSAAFQLGFSQTNLDAELTGDNAASSAWNDLRFYVNWGNMIDTDYANMGGRVRVQLPTTSASRNKSFFLRADLFTFWNFKVDLPKWSFDLMTIVSPRWFLENKPGSTTDFQLIAEPSVSYSFTDIWSVSSALTLITDRKYGTGYFDFDQAAEDQLKIQVGWAPISHFSASLGPVLFIDKPEFANTILVAELKVSL
jgi:hypothetical protein